MSIGKWPYLKGYDIKGTTALGAALAQAGPAANVHSSAGNSASAPHAPSDCCRAAASRSGASMSIGKWLDLKGYDIKGTTAPGAALARASAAAAAIPAPRSADASATVSPALLAPIRVKREAGVKEEPGVQRERHAERHSDKPYEPWLDTLKGAFKPIQVRLRLYLVKACSTGPCRRLEGDVCQAAAGLSAAEAALAPPVHSYRREQAASWPHCQSPPITGHHLLTGALSAQVRWAGDRCSVCDSDVDFSSDQLVSCDLCGLTVHQSCYGVSELPSEDDMWLCRACELKVLPCMLRPMLPGTVHWPHCCMAVARCSAASALCAEPAESPALLMCRLGVSGTVVLPLHCLTSALSAGGGSCAAAVLPVPCDRWRAEASHAAAAVVPCDLHAVDPGGARGGCHAHGACRAHRVHPAGALGADLLPVQVRTPAGCQTDCMSAEQIFLACKTLTLSFCEHEMQQLLLPLPTRSRQISSQPFSACLDCSFVSILSEPKCQRSPELLALQAEGRRQDPVQHLLLVLPPAMRAHSWAAHGDHGRPQPQRACAHGVLLPPALHRQA